MMERFIAEAADSDRAHAMRRALDHLNQAWGRDHTTHAYIAATVRAGSTPASSTPSAVLTS